MLIILTARFGLSILDELQKLATSSYKFFGAHVHKCTLRSSTYRLLAFFEVDLRIPYSLLNIIKI